MQQIQQKSHSRYIEWNGDPTVSHDEKGNLLEGDRIAEDRKTILRFHKGLLDGDVYDNNNNIIITKPAVESSGHIEYWRGGKLHRDYQLPAVSTEGFCVKEWWENGIRQDVLKECL